MWSVFVLCSGWAIAISVGTCSRRQQIDLDLWWISFPKNYDVIWCLKCHPRATARSSLSTAKYSLYFILLVAVCSSWVIVVFIGRNIINHIIILRTSCTNKWIWIELCASSIVRIRFDLLTSIQTVTHQFQRDTECIAYNPGQHSPKIAYFQDQFPFHSHSPHSSCYGFRLRKCECDNFSSSMQRLLSDNVSKNNYVD